MTVLLNAAEAATESQGIGERLGNAGLNTLMGMGIVFLVLILISLIISAFSIIHKLEEKKDLKKKAPETDAKKTPEADARVLGLGSKPAEPQKELPGPAEELKDDRELAAVIAAAIAAFTGADPSGFTVRSIRRIQNNGRRR